MEFYSGNIGVFLNEKLGGTVFPVHEQAPHIQPDAGCGSYSEAAQPHPLLWFNTSLLVGSTSKN